MHRHNPPRFTTADWGFVEPKIAATVRWPGWYRALPPAQREAIERRFWAEGRLKLEPWLLPRLARSEIRRWPHASVTAAREVTGGAIAATLSRGETLFADHVILATGYQTDLTRVPYLAGVLDQLRLAGGFPVLDERFQTNVPGLYIPGFRGHARLRTPLRLRPRRHRGSHDHHQRADRLPTRRRQCQPGAAIGRAPPPCPSPPPEGCRRQASRPLTARTPEVPPPQPALAPRP